MATVKKAQAGLKASNKRVGPIDPKGAWTKVQEMNLPPKNKKTSVKLTKDKQLGATKMAKMGGKMTKAKGGRWIQKVAASIKRRGTEGVCTGANFGGPGCPPGSRRYNLAKTFRKMAKGR